MSGSCRIRSRRLLALYCCSRKATYVFLSFSLSLAAGFLERLDGSPAAAARRVAGAYGSNGDSRRGSPVGRKESERGRTTMTNAISRCSFIREMNERSSFSYPCAVGLQQCNAVNYPRLNGDEASVCMRSVFRDNCQMSRDADGEKDYADGFPRYCRTDEQIMCEQFCVPKVPADRVACAI